MEKKIPRLPPSEYEFLNLLQLAQNGDNEAVTQLIVLFEDDISHLVKYVKLQKEDAYQSILVELVYLFKKTP